MTLIYNTKPYLPDMNSYTKDEANWSKDAQDRAWKRNCYINQGHLLCIYLKTITHLQSQTTPS